MSYAHRHGWELHKLDQRAPSKLPLTPPAAPPMPEYDYRCANCGDDVIGDVDRSGRVCCGRCGSTDVTKVEDL